MSDHFFATITYDYLGFVVTFERSIMKKNLILLLFSILFLSLSGCKNSSKMETTISNSAEYFTNDSLIQVEKLPWDISSEEAREIIGDINEEYLNAGSKIHLVPIAQLTFTDLSLISSIRCYYFDEQDQLYKIWYSFSFTDREQAKQKMQEVIEYLKENLPTTFQYQYEEGSRRTLIDYVTMDVFEIPMASWMDETGAQLLLTIEPYEESFRLNIYLSKEQIAYE